MTCVSLDAPLFECAVEAARDRLSASAFASLLPGEVVADLFCGAGGWGEGLKLLGGRVHYAINHSPDAITTHAVNNPECAHHLGDAWKARPREVIGKARLGLLLASAACTTHSRAKGAAPVSPRVHMLGWCIARWMEEAAPRLVLIENVPEWKDWGPLVAKRDENGRELRDAQGRLIRVQDPKRKGQHFRRWWRYCERLGYVMEMRVLDAPDYGEASRRRRLFIIARRDSQPIVWPEVTHGDTGSNPVERVGTSVRDRHQKHEHGDGTHNDETGVGKDGKRLGQNGRRDRGLLPYRTAADIIDWSDLGKSIFGRRQALKPKTQARIAEGIRRYVIADADPFVLRVTHGEGSWKVSLIDAPLPTQTTRQDLAVCSPVTAGAGGCTFGPARLDVPYHAVLPREDTGIVAPVLATTRNGERDGQAPRCHSVQTPAMTITGGAGQGIAAPVMQVIRGDVAGRSVTDPLATITAGNGPGRGAGAAHAQGIATPVCIHAHHGGGQATRADSPVPAITSGGVHANIAVPLTTDYYGNASTAHRADAALGTVTTLDRHGLVGVMLGLSAAGAARALETAAWLRKHLGDAVPIEDGTGLAYTVIGGVRRYFIDILFRMLRALELAAAMGFPADYVWPRTRTGSINQRVAVRMIGNAVSVRTARALIASVLPGLAATTRKAVRA